MKKTILAIDLLSIFLCILLLQMFPLYTLADESSTTGYCQENPGEIPDQDAMTDTLNGYSIDSDQLKSSPLSGVSPGCIAAPAADIRQTPVHPGQSYPTRIHQGIPQKETQSKPPYLSSKRSHINLSEHTHLG